MEASLCLVCNALTYCAYASLFNAQFEILIILPWFFLNLFLGSIVGYRRVVFSWYLSLGCGFASVDYLMNCCHIARYLAAKFGTNSGVLI